ncbi:Protein_21.1 [Hexamita inflata]|uniref:Protein 21.1 n=1 Tax=Hexamita inflata TaxID=28002 RepID=A0AA86P7J0_9EUKA|nr:Protein 21.1 [Hexamita inflata]
MISLLVDEQNDLLNNFNTEQIYCDPVTQFDIIHIAIILKRVEFIQKYSNLCSKQSKLPYFHLALQYLPGVAYLFEFEIDRVNENNETSLMYAVKGNNIYWAKQLIYQAGKISNQKQTALNFAKSDEMIRLLQMENNYSLQSRKLPREHYFKSIKLFMEQNKEMKQLALDVKEADDFIKNNLQQKLKDFKQLNQDWCNRIDNCIDLNQIENEEENWVLAEISCFQQEKLFLSPLLYAVMTNNIQAVSILKQKFIKTACKLTGVTGLLLALRLGYENIANILLQERSMYTLINVTPFVAAVAGNLFEYGLKHFIDQKDINDNLNKSPLLQAVVTHNVAAFNYLIYQAVDIYTSSWTPLQAAAYYGFNDFVHELVPYQAGQSHPQGSALMRAVQRDNISGVKMLVKFEACMVDKQNIFASINAVVQKNTQVLNLLVDYERDLKMQEFSCVDIAIQYDSPECLDILLKKKVGSAFDPIFNAVMRQNTACLRVCMKYLQKDIKINNQCVLEQVAKLNLFNNELQNYFFSSNQNARAFALAVRADNPGAELAISSQFAFNRAECFEYEV